jgi:hypothetical protein
MAEEAIYSDNLLSEGHLSSGMPSWEEADAYIKRTGEPLHPKAAVWVCEPGESDYKPMFYWETSGLAPESVIYIIKTGQCPPPAKPVW